MDINEVITLIEVLDKSELRYLKLKHGNKKIILSKDANPVDSIVSDNVNSSSDVMESTKENKKIKDVKNNTIDTNEVPNEINDNPKYTELSSTNKELNETTDLKIVNAPLMGTFYSAPNPDAKPFVSIGDKVKSGDVLCILEAMKMLNEISSEFDGEIVEILVKNEDLVEYNQPMFKIKPL